MSARGDVRVASASSVKSSTAIDPNQLLSLCYRINENVDKLDRSINLVQLRLTSIDYQLAASRDAAANAIGGSSAAPVKCLNDLADLCQLSQSLVRQLDELQVKLNEEDPRSSISYHIASQQLAYFTSEWYDNLTPKFNAVLEMAHEFKLDERAAGTGGAGRNAATLSRIRAAYTRGNTRAKDANDDNGGGLEQFASSAAETRVREALVRLKQSMSENERLIASISSNLDYTKATIESIYQSLRATKVNLEEGEQNATESIQIVRSSERSKMCLMMTCAAVLVIVLLIVLRLIGII